MSKRLIPKVGEVVTLLNHAEDGTIWSGEVLSAKVQDLIFLPPAEIKIQEGHNPRNYNLPHNRAQEILMTQEQIANSYQDALKIIKDRRVELCNGIEVVYQKLVRITNYLDRQAAAELAESMN